MDLLNLVKDNIVFVIILAIAGLSLVYYYFVWRKSDAKHAPPKKEEEEVNDDEKAKQSLRRYVY